MHDLIMRSLSWAFEDARALWVVLVAVPVGIGLGVFATALRRSGW